jgi:hypothetical protein
MNEYSVSEPPRNVTVTSMPAITVNATGSDGAILDGVDANIKATVIDLASSNPQAVAIVDGSGAQITSFGGGTQYADGAARGTATGTMMIGDDGTNVQSVHVDTSGDLQVDVLTMPTTAVTGTFWQATQPVSGTFYQATQPVSIAAAVGVTDNAGSLTVDAPVATPVFVRLSDGAAAITTLPVSLASVPSHAVTNAGTFAVQSTNQANSGVDIGDVTINNATGVAAVNIQDGGNSITVDGTFWQATQPVSGTFWQATQPVSLASTTITGTVTTKEVRSATPTQTSVSVTSASTSILASNANRLGATITNEGTAICYLKLGATASVTSYSCQVASGGYYEVPFAYTGAIDGITSASTAQLRITEITA